MKNQEQLEQQFKFTKMEKRIPFFPSLTAKGEFDDRTKFNGVGISYLDSTAKHQLLFPAKAFEKDKKWAHNSYSSNLF